MQNVTSVRVSSLRASVNAYIGLMKPHVTVLLLGTTLAAMAVAGWPRLEVVLATLLGGALAAGSANALNCYWDRDIDQIMSRTQRRALPAGRLAPAQALTFGLAAGALSFVVLAVWVNLLSAVLALSAILFYVLIYTLVLKRRTSQNIVIGGAAGAIPPLVGWAAATGSLDLAALLLFAIVFLWTPPHFWALALLIRRDYERAEVPMLPVTEGERKTTNGIVGYTAALVAATLLFAPAAGVGADYLVPVGAAGVVFAVLAVALWRRPTPAAAGRLFKYSLLYLAIVFAAVAIAAG